MLGETIIPLDARPTNIMHRGKLYPPALCHLLEQSWIAMDATRGSLWQREKEDSMSSRYSGRSRAA